MSNSKERLIKCNIHPQFQLHFRKGEVIKLDGYQHLPFCLLLYLLLLELLGITSYILLCLQFL
ncbi:unnamed protein product [Paramecium octaurelia]|uniref:Uncharacterized protein n=1 Tax=Paramecium octaurelia TaxID=43137 RepID=A0A8S1U0K4_PAROT|nr:unnamed protein product [Paramecium octaurelia]